MDYIGYKVRFIYIYIYCSLGFSWLEMLVVRVWKYIYHLFFLDNYITFQSIHKNFQLLLLRAVFGDYFRHSQWWDSIGSFLLGYLGNVYWLLECWMCFFAIFHSFVLYQWLLHETYCEDLVRAAPLTMGRSMSTTGFQRRASASPASEISNSWPWA